jgi:hypothetical protein
MNRRGWGRWSVRIGLWIGAVFVAGGAALFVINPFGALVLVWFTVQILFSNSHPPAIAEGQITEDDWEHQNVAGQKLTDVLKRRFPIGTTEAVMKSTLLGQGFKLPAPPPRDCVPPGQIVTIGHMGCPTYDVNKILLYHWGLIPCGETVTVEWTVDDSGGITSVRGGYYGVCL